eukprot:SM000027S09608  [mRNA]  locus=s27:301252:304972:+ [translate_table: standard]
MVVSAAVGSLTTTIPRGPRAPHPAAMAPSPPPRRRRPVPPSAPAAPLALALAVAVVTSLAAGHELCLDSGGPFAVGGGGLQFCSQPAAYSTKGCCTPADDAELRLRFTNMSISDAACATVVKKLLCAVSAFSQTPYVGGHRAVQQTLILPGHVGLLLMQQCDPWAAHLFGLEAQAPRGLPYLCSAAPRSSAGLPPPAPPSAESASALDTAPASFCTAIWRACQNASLLNSPFAALLPSSSAPSGAALRSNLSALFASEEAFCTAAGPQSAATAGFCYNGTQFELPASEPYTALGGVCLERIARGAYLNLVPHPDGSQRAFANTQRGKVFLVGLPAQTSGKAVVKTVAPFLDLSDRLLCPRLAKQHSIDALSMLILDLQSDDNGEMGLLGLAFHPSFVTNGRFFVSYNCDMSKHADCAAECVCNAKLGCNPSEGGVECAYASVIAEYYAPPNSSRAIKKEVRRVITLGQPYSNHKGGQLRFGPEDGYLYLQFGDGGKGGDPWNFAQNLAAPLWQDLFLTEGTYGNYSIPYDNPFVGRPGALGEIWAYGLRNPWKCSFDRERPSYHICGDVGQDAEEEVDIITRGGNYGWRLYEGTFVYNASPSPGQNFSKASPTLLTWPILEYSHVSLDNGGTGASVIGGYISRSAVDLCLYGRYLYNDYSGPMWAASEEPLNSGNFTSTRVSYTCASDSPISCSLVGSSSTPDLGLAWGWGKDDLGDLYALTETGIYRIVAPDRCNIVCNKTLPSPPPPLPRSSRPPPPLPKSPPPVSLTPPNTSLQPSPPLSPPVGQPTTSSPSQPPPSFLPPSPKASPAGQNLIPPPFSPPPSAGQGLHRKSRLRSQLLVLSSMCVLSFFYF